MSRKKRGFYVDLDDEVFERFKERFCYVQINGNRVKVRSLTSVVLEAFLKGALQMTRELKALREEFGPSMYLDDAGASFEDVRRAVKKVE